MVLQEWMAEAFTMWGLAALVVAATLVGGAGIPTTEWVYRIAAGILVAIAVLTSFTGSRTPVIWFKVCPVLQIGSAGLLVTASLL